MYQSKLLKDNFAHKAEGCSLTLAWLKQSTRSVVCCMNKFKTLKKSLTYCCNQNLSYEFAPKGKMSAVPMSVK